ncbi:MAG: hypothetical protein IJT87_12240 [Ruminiclostridium sp.]|nr:hypothetical protein [Ruminiclostridium sp.]
MADAKQDKNKEKKEPNSEGFGFKTAMGGFDKNEVNLYINKLKKQMKEQEIEFERRISNLQTNLEDAHKENAQAKTAQKAAEQAAATASAPVIKDSSAETKKLIDDLKAESDKKIMELRKSVLDERRNVAKFDKECAMAKMSEKKVREQYDSLKTKYLELKKKGGGSTAKPVTTHNADEVLDEVGKYAKELISAAKKYAEDTVKAVDKYKADVEAELKERSDKINDIRKRLDEQIKKTEQEQKDSAAKIKDITSKIGSLTVMFDSFSTQFNSVNSQISGVTGQIDDICRQFNDTTSRIGSVAKQITDTTVQINNVSKQINDTTSQIDSFSKAINDTTSKITGFAQSINETTDKINEASKQMTETSSKFSETTKSMTEATGLIAEASKKMSETTGKFDETSKQISGFTDKLTSAKGDIEGITKLVDSTKISIKGAKGEINDAQAAAKIQASSADLSPISKIGAELEKASGVLKAKLELPKFDESKFSEDNFDAIKKKFRIETTYEQSEGSAAVDDEDDIELEDNNIISSMEIDSPEPSDEDLMADMPDVITAPVFEDSRSAKSAPAKDKADRPGLDAEFEDFFMTPPKDDDMSGEMPLINMEGVGAVDDFTLDTTPDPVGTDDFVIKPIDKTAKPDKGADLGADIFDIAIDPDGTDDDTLANMMAEAEAAEKAANTDLTPADLNFDEESAMPSTPSDDFGEFADLFAAGSSQTSAETKKDDGMAFRKKPSNDPWDFGDSAIVDDSDLSADSDLSDLLI